MNVKLNTFFRRQKNRLNNRTLSKGESFASFKASCGFSSFRNSSFMRSAFYLKSAVFFWLLLPFLLTCCKPPSVKKETQRTVLVYMVADNNLNAYALQNMTSMKQNLDADAMETGRLLVFYVPPYAETQQLIEIKINTSTGLGDTLTLHEYSFENTLDKNAMQQVIRDVKRLAPAKSYGMVLWSHAMGWHPYTSVLDPGSLNPPALQSEAEAPKGKYLPSPAATKLSASSQSELRASGAENIKDEDLLGWFGQDGYYYMEIPVLASALEGQGLEFLLFDACFTASVEMLYDLRHSADYLIGSPAEVMGAGFPYKDFVKLVFREDLSTEALCRQLCQAYMTAYRANTTYPSASTVLVKLSEMDSLAACARAIFEADPLPVSNIDLGAVQYYELMNPHLFYDLNDYLSAVSRYPMFYVEFENQLKRTVLYKDCTDQIYSAYNVSHWFDVSSYSGLSAYIPRYDLPYSQKIINLNQAYFQTAWAQATGQTAP